MADTPDPAGGDEDADGGGSPRPATVGWPRALGVAGGAAGLAASLFVLFGPVASYERQTVGGDVATGTVSGVDYLLGEPNAQFALLAWPLVIGVVSAVGAVAAWHGRSAWLWAAAVTVAGFAVVGLASVGGLYLPAAVLLLVAAALARAR